MTEIRVLPEEVIGKIAAGEVVERPAQLIKELIENSIDAEASSIEVDFSNGGRQVYVKDNGHGIRSTDLALAFQRFATSKIIDYEDLWKLSSFGFRGEALASIGACAKVTLTSRYRASTDESGQQILCEYGRLSAVVQVSSEIGTKILVEDLFANVPARLKFMKTDKGESSAIKQSFKAMALANPKVEFRLSVEGRLVLWYPQAKNHLERVETVLECHPLYEGVALVDGVKARSYFSDPNTANKTSKNIWLFAQGRYIQDRSLSAAVMEAYRNLLMHGEFPTAAVFIEAPPDQIDVNIHPTKSAVKFSQASSAFRAVTHSLRDTLEKAPWLKELFEKPSSTLELYKEDLQERLFDNLQVQNQIQVKKEPVQETFEGSEFTKTQYLVKAWDIVKQPTTDEIKPQKLIEEEFRLRQTENKLGVSASEGFWSRLQVLGQSGLTYIIGQSNQGLVFIDQHAAHERVLFEKLMNTWKSGGVQIQNHLFPLVLDLSEDRIEALKKAQPELGRLGVELEDLGPSSLGVKSSPLFIKDSILVKELSRLATECLDQGDSFRFEKAIGDVCARWACHSAVRAGQSLSVPEMQGLLQQMDEFPNSCFCPHGRPVYVNYSFLEIEKDFGRSL